jgi:hypothetical protein
LGFALMLLAGACGRGAIDDPIDGVALSRQKTISRADFGFRWPLSVGVATLACAEDGAILLRTQRVTYTLSGSRPRAADIEPLRVLEPSPPPSNPLKRMTQDRRMEVFQSMLRCESGGRIDDTCRGVVLARFGLSGDDWGLIDVEGHERRWPPLARELMPLEPLIAAGRALCGLPSPR